MGIALSNLVTGQANSDGVSLSEFLKNINDMTKAKPPMDTNDTKLFKSMGASLSSVTSDVVDRIDRDLDFRNIQQTVANVKTDLISGIQDAIHLVDVTYKSYTGISFLESINTAFMGVNLANMLMNDPSSFLGQIKNMSTYALDMLPPDAKARILKTLERICNMPPGSLTDAALNALTAMAALSVLSLLACLKNNDYALDQLKKIIKGELVSQGIPKSVASVIAAGVIKNGVTENFINTLTTEADVKFTVTKSMDKNKLVDYIDYKTVKNTSTGATLVSTLGTTVLKRLKDNTKPSSSTYDKKTGFTAEAFKAAEPEYNDEESWYTTLDFIGSDSQLSLNEILV